MQSYAARYASFTPPHRPKSSSKVAPDPRWPHPDSYLATPTSLATAGFYFNPSAATPDAVSCFICDKGLADWDPDDDPAQIHAEKCPKCPWAILKCVTDAEDDGSFNFASPSRLPTSRAMEKARHATFFPDTKKSWPHDTKNKGPTSKTMAKAGFVYIPASTEDDTCTCIYCGVELSGWEPEDDPMEEHRSRQAKTGPCPFFTHSTDAPPLTKQRARTKSKPPPTTAIASASSDEEYQPPGTKSSNRPPTASTGSKKPSGSAKSTKSKPSKKPAQTKTIEEEVVEEYHIALDEDEDAPPKPRPKPRRASSRASSRSRASSAQNITPDETEPPPSSTRKSSSSKPKSKSKREPSLAEDDIIPVSSSSFKKSTSKPSSSKKRGESEETKRSTRSRSRPPSNQDGHVRVPSKSKPAATAVVKGKGKGRVDVDDMEVEDEPAEKLARSRKGKGKSKAIEEEAVEEEPEPEPPRGRSKAKAKAVEETEEEDLEPLRGKPNGRPKVLPKAHEVAEEPEPARERSKGNPKAALKDGKHVEADTLPEPDPAPRPQPQPASRRSKPSSNGKIKSPAKAVTSIEGGCPDPEPVREKIKTRTKPPSKAKDNAPALVQQKPDPPIEADDDALQLVPETTPPSKPAPARASQRHPQLNGINNAHHPPAPAPIPCPQFKSFQSPEDEEFAREEEALEEQARELMLADATFTLTATPLGKGKGKGKEDVMPELSFEKLNGVLSVEKDKGKAEMSTAKKPMDIDEPPPPAPSTPPPTRPLASATKPALPSTTKFPQLVPNDTLTSLTDAERAMTVEQWVRHEMDRQYERLRSDGRQKIDAFKARADEVARQIESL